MLLKLLKRSQASQSNSALICKHLLYIIMSSFSFQHHALVSRRLNKAFKVFVESKVQNFCKDRSLHYKFVPGFIYPTRNNKIIQLPNKVHVYLYHYFPDYNQWIFNYILPREIYLTMDTLNHRRTTFCYKIFQFKKIKYLKLMNLGIVGMYLAGLVAQAERICFRNVVFSQINKEVVRSDCKYLTMKGCVNIQHMYNTRFINVNNLNIIRCDVMKDTFKIFSGEALTHIKINQSFSFDDDLAKYLALESPFCNIRHLDLSSNRIGFQGLCHVMSGQSVYVSALEWLGMEGNQINASLAQVVARMQLPNVRYLDLSMNQIEWDQNSIEFSEYCPPTPQGSTLQSMMSKFNHGGWRLLKRIKEKRALNEIKTIKIQSVEIAVSDDLVVKVTDSQDLYKD